MAGHLNNRRSISLTFAREIIPIFREEKLLNMRQLIILSLAILTFASCEKFGEHEGRDRDRNRVTELNNDIVVQMDDSHTFILPEDAEGEFSIIEDALNAQLSELGTSNDGQATYTYEPNNSFIGADQVILSNVQDREVGCGFGGSACGEEEAQGKFYNITLNIDVQSEADDN